MRILHIIATCGPGGQEVFVRDLSLECQRRGHTVAIAYFSSAQEHGGNPAFEASYQASLDAAGIAHFKLGHAARRNPLLGAAALFRACRAFRPDVIHAHMATALASRTLTPTRARTLYTHHSSKLTFPSAVFVVFDRVVDLYVGICQPCETLLRGVVRKNVICIRNGIDASRIPFPGPRAIGSEVALLSVGGLRVEKRYDILIEAAAQVKARLPAGMRARFQIAGEGPERGKLEALIRAHRLDDTVTLLGARADVATLMMQAHALVMSSEREGLPITLIEGATSGLPLVCTDVGGCRDVVFDGENGFVAPPLNPLALADRVLDLITAPDRAHAMSLRSREIAASLQIERAADLYLDAYARVLA